MASDPHSWLTEKDSKTLRGPSTRQRHCRAPKPASGRELERWVNKGCGVRTVLRGCGSARSKGEVRAERGLGALELLGFQASAGGSHRGAFSRHVIPLLCH